MIIKIMYNGIKIDGKLYKGGWSYDSYYDRITWYADTYCRDKRLPDCGGLFRVENDSDMMTDYFEKDRVRFESSHPLYTEALAAIRESQMKFCTRWLAKCTKKAERVGGVWIKSAAQARKQLNDLRTSINGQLRGAVKSAAPKPKHIKHIKKGCTA